MFIFMTNNTIYFDYAATSPLDPRVVHDMQNCLTLEGTFANSGSWHSLGREASEKIETFESIQLNSCQT
jgi:cysteine desulfurase